MSHRRSAAASSSAGSSSETKVMMERRNSIIDPSSETVPFVTPAGAKSSSTTTTTSSAGVVVGALSLESGGPSCPDSDHDEAILDPPDLDGFDPEQRFEVERHHKRLKHWMEHPFAVGLVPPTWREERTRTRDLYGDNELQSDESGCLCCSALVCTRAGRVGNMIVLRSSTEWVEEVEEGEGEEKVRRHMRPRLDCVVGPYWPMLAFVTYPLILGVSGWTLVIKIVPGRTSSFMAFGWAVLTVGLITALAFTACCDPGIQYKYKKPPPQYENQWRWTDRAHSYRSRNAFYDADTGVVVEGFDHTCPWTGTAIGRKNMLPFQVFVCLVFLCMMMNIFMLTGVFDIRR